ncbi:hypothetical protein CROQUDRAFT_102148 [Cronartium quercuum f. sp. fusiforme G11]|uniref:Uncharacterized protein n=1 Tax=Cronartium quercuum f. sp. fusiforme G11 TaxID=708437 RepID=A0A9P6N849_9BASI|nr:hypothetical protein CROQUDRAFT_102148 [Cronartium quercuum f. sp. fusiforme G11]
MWNLRGPSAQKSSLMKRTLERYNLTVKNPTLRSPTSLVPLPAARSSPTSPMAHRRPAGNTAIGAGIPTNSPAPITHLRSLSRVSRTSTSIEDPEDEDVALPAGATNPHSGRAAPVHPSSLEEDVAALGNRPRPPPAGTTLRRATRTATKTRVSPLTQPEAQPGPSPLLVSEREAQTLAPPRRMPTPPPHPPMPGDESEPEPDLPHCQYIFIAWKLAM